MSKQASRQAGSQSFCGAVQEGSDYYVCGCVRGKGIKNKNEEDPLLSLSSLPCCWYSYLVGPIWEFGGF
jgi:hypothetical protein